eukprot:UN06864
MIFQILLSTTLIAIVQGAGCDVKWPNGTDTALHWWQCDSSPVKFYNATTSFVNGTSMYPLYLDGLMLIKADMYDPSYTFKSPNLRGNGSIWSWGGHSGCVWSTVPTFGMTDNLDACEYGVPCPVYPGRQWLTIRFDLTKFQKITQFLTNDAPY